MILKERERIQAHSIWFNSAHSYLSFATCVYICQIINMRLILKKKKATNRIIARISDNSQNVSKYLYNVCV